jgi:8-oxo-dGTP pyrophosphatase MutT (NUDIX family)
MPESFDLAGLSRLLQEHRASDAQEEAHLGAMQALLQGSENPLSRKSFDPGHFTASAFVLSPDHRALLLIHHRKLRRWLQPGGHIEADDADVVAAARREVEEETRAATLRLLREEQPLLDVDVHPIPAHGSEPFHHHHDLRVAFVAATDEIRAGEEVVDARWVGLDEIGEVESDASVMRAVARLRTWISSA